MSGEINVTNPDKPKKVLIVIANPATSTTLGISVGFWGAELTHTWGPPSRGRATANSSTQAPRWHGRLVAEALGAWRR